MLISSINDPEWDPTQPAYQSGAKYLSWYMLHVVLMKVKQMRTFELIEILSEVTRLRFSRNTASIALNES